MREGGVGVVPRDSRDSFCAREREVTKQYFIFSNLKICNFYKIGLIIDFDHDPPGGPPPCLTFRGLLDANNTQGHFGPARLIIERTSIMWNKKNLIKNNNQ